MGTLYDLLGVPSFASKQVIKKSFYELSKAHHPDMATGSHDRFKDIQHAYSILINEEKRREYDARHVNRRAFTHRTSYPQYDLKEKQQRTRAYAHHYAQHPFYNKFHEKKREEEYHQWKQNNSINRADANSRMLIGSAMLFASLVFLYI